MERETNFVAALVTLLNIPIWYGFAPKCWCTVHEDEGRKDVIDVL
jgi:hypothetical protein